jgi:integrase
MLDPNWISRRFKTLLAAAGLPPIRLHDVRHSWATAAIRGGVHLKIISEHLGHGNIAVTSAVYSHVTEEMDKQAAEDVAQIIFGIASP